ncbi:MAG: RNA-binding S4 domain-containing protein [Phascolarctobacterium sp.]|nr:RNA-binding S4 domain-containing protein [Phascolarctobacterium sp.]
MDKEEILINTEYIEIDKLLKVSGIAESGGKAFMMVEQGRIRLNGKTVSEKRRKIRPGDIVNIDGKMKLTVMKKSDENK